MAHHFQRGLAYPSEGFVQAAIEEHFLALGFTVEPSRVVDLLCCHPAAQERWHIEAKGVTSQVGLDFRTGLGQLVQRMSTPATKYALALPDTPAFRTQMAQVAPWVRQALGLHWLVVGADKAVTVLPPDGAVDLA